MSHKKYRNEHNCLNCGAVVERKFCPECGQENLDLKENFFHVAGHVTADFFHYDSKFLGSIIPLFSKPGFLTKEYWEGRRVRYIHPLRLFFFVTIIFMISTTYFYQHFSKTIQDEVVHVQSENPAKKSSPSVEQKLKEAAAERAEEEKSKLLLYHGMDGFFKNLKYISFFLLPVYALIFKVLYRKKKNLYVDHLVFTLHIQSFAYILIAAVLLLPFIFPDALTIIRRLTLLTILIYMIFALKRLYQQGWFKTILKSFLATLSMVILMAMVMGIFMAVSLMTGQS
jgi:hypothetical protein